MSRMAEMQMDQQEQENQSGMNEYLEWIESIENSYWCPYCGSILSKQIVCCGENHMRLISEMNEEEKESIK